MNYQIGDMVEYKTIMGRTRTVVVTGTGEEGGYPVFDGEMSDGSTVWGYDEDIISVTKGDRQ